MSTRKRRPRGELRAFRKHLVAVTRDSKRPAGVETGRAETKHHQA